MNLKGQTLGDYHLESVIGRGPRATVYRARHMADHRIVAVKVYDDSADPDAIRRAFESTQALTGAHVLPVEGFGVHHGLAYVAMRYMPKGSLKARWRRAAPMADIARVLPQIASALDHAHGLGVWHLNLKPGNILLDRPGNAFVADLPVPPPPAGRVVQPAHGRPALAAFDSSGPPACRRSCDDARAVNRSGVALCDARRVGSGLCRGVGGGRRRAVVAGIVTPEPVAG